MAEYAIGITDRSAVERKNALAALLDISRLPMNENTTNEGATVETNMPIVAYLDIRALDLACPDLFLYS